MDVPRDTIAGTLLPGETSTVEMQMENMVALSEIVDIGVEDGYLTRRDPAWNWTSPTHSHIFFKKPLLSTTACSSRLCRSIPLLQVHISDPYIHHKLYPSIQDAFDQHHHGSHRHRRPRQLCPSLFLRRQCPGHLGPPSPQCRCYVDGS